LSKQTQFSPSILLIFELSQLHTNDKNIVSLINKITNWNTFIDFAHAHGVFTHIHKQLMQYKGIIPVDIQKNLKQAYILQIKESMLITAELIKTIQIFDNTNTKAIAFKGPLLSQFAYGNITARQYADIDILVDVATVYETAQILLKNKYFTEDSIELLKNKKFLEVANDFSFFTPKGVHVELHWKLFREKIGKNSEFSIYFRDKTTVNINQYAINSLSTEWLLVYLCLHGSKHAWERIEWINDIYMLLQHTIDWERTQVCAKQMECETSLYLGLNLVSNLYDISLPKKMLVKINTPKIDNLRENVYKFLNDNLLLHENYLVYKQIKAFQSKLLDSKQKQMILFVSNYMSITRNDILALPLPEKLQWLYYLIKPFRVFYKIVIKRK